MDRSTLEDIINKNIYARYEKNPGFFAKKWYFNIYRKTSIPEEGIGDITDIYISMRGKSGNVMEMVLETSTGTYKVYNEYNIRRLLTPQKLTLTPLYGKDMKDISYIPSSFFVIDKQLSKGKIKSVTIYGGGYGHGVGMSQYGVIGLVRNGKNYAEILDTFYKNVDLKDFKDALKTSF
jgi:SpoIID/LytB domain protein